MSDEFPAAHSMDTMWFAIDRDGHVAGFASREAGAVPRDVATGGEGGYDHLDTITTLAPCEGLLDVAGFRTMFSGPDHVEVGEPPLGRILVFVGELAPIADLVPRLTPHVYPGTSGNVLLVASVDRIAFAELHARGACLGCTTTYCSVRPERLAGHGVYAYSHSDLFENWIAGPYARLEVPATPIVEATLPASVREAAIRFAGRFADHAELQPAEHWPAWAHSEAWVASDHKTHRSFETGEIVTDDDD